MKPFTHCSYCGTHFPEGDAWPKQCTSCGHTTWRNPLPVAVLLIPTEEGLVGIRRQNTEKAGELALPGGFVTLGETWQEAAAREAFEETLIRVDPSTIKHFDVVSAGGGTVLIFGLAPYMKKEDLPAFIPTHETSERVFLAWHQKLAFPIHEQVMNEYFLQAYWTPGYSMW